MKNLLFIKISGILLFILGVIHVIGTFTPLMLSGFDCVEASAIDVLTFSSIVIGGSFILCGFLTIILSTSALWVRWRAKWALIFISVYASGVGFVAILYIPQNPFAMIALVIGLAHFLSVLTSMSLKTA